MRIIVSHISIFFIWNQSVTMSDFYDDCNRMGEFRRGSTSATADQNEKEWFTYDHVLWVTLVYNMSFVNYCFVFEFTQKITVIKSFFIYIISVNCFEVKIYVEMRSTSLLL